MIGHDIPFLWCLIQVALLATLGVGAAWLFARRAPAAGASAAAAAAAMIAVVTLLIPARVPKFELWQPSHSGDLAVEALPVALDEKRAANASAASGGLAFEVEDLAARALASVGASGMAKQEFGPLIETFAGRLFACGAAVGMVRFLWSLSFVARLRKQRTPVVDEDLLRLFMEVKSRLGIAQAVQLCESARVSSPAVIGWRRPVVLMPVDRGGWSAEQLRAALAHELAHVKRGDYAWRCLAGMTQAVHYVHPLVHVLTRRLTLMQELATDAVAARAAGGRETYLRALSELAIRLDDTSRLRAEPIVLPALSSHLVRRIAMLRSREGSEAARSCRFTSVLAAGLIAAVGMGTMALRGNAEAVAPTSGSVPMRETAAAEGESASRELFAREVIDVAQLGGGDQGAFIVRVGELARVPALAEVFPLLNGMIYDELTQQVGVAVDDIPAIHLEEIEWIAGTPRLKIKPKTGPDKGQEGQVMFECDGFVIRFPAKVDWKSWIFKAMPGAQAIGEVRGEKFDYVELPLLMGGTAFGGQRFLVAERDERTLVVSPDLAYLRKLATSTGADSSAALGAEWRSLGGGLATLVVNTVTNGPLGSPQEPGAQLAVSILEKSRRFGIAFDTEPVTGQSHVRSNFTVADQAAAERVKGALEELLPMLAAQVKADLAHPTQLHVDKDDPSQPVQTMGDDNTDDDVGNFWLAMLKSCAPQVAPQADGDVWVELTATATLPRHVVVAYEYVEQEAAEDKQKVKRR